MGKKKKEEEAGEGEEEEGDTISNISASYPLNNSTGGYRWNKRSRDESASYPSFTIIINILYKMQVVLGGEGGWETGRRAFRKEVNIWLCVRFASFSIILGTFKCVLEGPSRSLQPWRSGSAAARHGVYSAWTDPRALRWVNTCLSSPSSLRDRGRVSVCC